MTTDALRHVLFVDDAPEQVRLSSQYFDRDSDVSLVTADSADEALSMLRQSDVDCLVSDSIRTSDGEPLVEIVKRSYPDLPVVLYSGGPREDLPIDVVDEYVRKGPSSSGTTSLADLRGAIRDLTSVDDRDITGAGTHGSVSDGWTSLGTFDWAESERVSVTVLDALADHTGLDLLEGPPLGETIDPDALDTLVRQAATADGSSLRVRFRFAGYRIEVTADGRVRYRASAADVSDGRT